LRDLADEFATVAAQARNDIVDVVDSEHDARMPSAFAGALAGSVLTARRRVRVELRQLNPAVAVRRPHHGEVRNERR
jgi:hypothetical protein